VERNEWEAAVKVSLMGGINKASLAASTEAAACGAPARAVRSVRGSASQVLAERGMDGSWFAESCLSATSTHLRVLVVARGRPHRDGRPRDGSQRPVEDVPGIRRLVPRWARTPRILGCRHQYGTRTRRNPVLAPE
jgi:hypothetical protein